MRLMRAANLMERMMFNSDSAPMLCHTGRLEMARGAVRTGWKGGIPLTLALLAGAASPAMAQKTYRCGNVYQPYPCSLADGKGGPSTASGKSDTSQKGGATAATSAPVKRAPLTPEQEKEAAAKKEEMVVAQKKDAAEKEKRTRCERVQRDHDYNNLQMKIGGSQTTMDRLKAERKQIDLDLKSAC